MMARFKHYRTVFLSDIHLGDKHCKADFLLCFLSHSRIYTLYLIGDMVDMWAMSRYLDIGCRHAASMGVDGIECGHIQHPGITEQDGILYCNDGDWVENCSALVEDHQGSLELVYWTGVHQAS